MHVRIRSKRKELKISSEKYQNFIEMDWIALTTLLQMFPLIFPLDIDSKKELTAILTNHNIVDKQFEKYHLLGGKTTIHISMFFFY